MTFDTQLHLLPKNSLSMKLCESKTKMVTKASYNRLVKIVVQVF